MEKEKQQGIIKKHIPWWLYLFVAILSYSVFKYLIPALASDQAAKERFAEAGNLAAPIIAILFLLLAANALYKNVPKDTPGNPDEKADEDAP